MAVTTRLVSLKGATVYREGKSSSTAAPEPQPEGDRPERAKGTCLAAVVDVAVSVVIAAAIVVTAEHRAGPSYNRAYRAADHSPDRAADRSPGGYASEGADRLRRGGAGTERETRQRCQGDLVHDRILPQYRQRNHIAEQFVPPFP